MSRWLLPLAGLVLATALLAGVASAQSAGAPSAATLSAPDEPVTLGPVEAAPASNSAGPRVTAAVSGVRASRVSVERVHSTQALPDALPQDNQPGFRRNVALIAVGLASIAIGSAVDDGAGTVLILGGAGLSLYGLYQILR
jgi:hypothetical protein